MAIVYSPPSRPCPGGIYTLSYSLDLQWAFIPYSLKPFPLVACLEGPKCPLLLLFCLTVDGAPLWSDVLSRWYPLEQVLSTVIHFGYRLIRRTVLETKESIMEKDVGSKTEPTTTTDYAAPAYGDVDVARPSFTRRIIDGFKRDPNARVTKSTQTGADGRVFDAEQAAANTANSPLQRRLKGRHLQMIAIGGSIGMLWD